jgi:hypothetical protein
MPPIFDAILANPTTEYVVAALVGLFFGDLIFRGLRAVFWFTAGVVIVALMVPVFAVGMLAAILTFFLRPPLRLLAAHLTGRRTPAVHGSEHAEPHPGGGASLPSTTDTAEAMPDDAAEADPNDWAPAWVRTPILVCSGLLGKSFAVARANLRRALDGDAAAAVSAPSGPVASREAASGNPAPDDLPTFGSDLASEDTCWVLPDSPTVDAAPPCEQEHNLAPDDDGAWAVSSCPPAEAFPTCDLEVDADDAPPEATPVAPRIVVLEMPAALVRSMQEWAADEDVPLRTQVMRELDGDTLLVKFLFRDATVALLAEERLEQMVAMRSWLGVTTGLS